MGGTCTMLEVRASQLAQTWLRLRPEEDQSIWSKRRQGFQPCCEAGIGVPTPFLYHACAYTVHTVCISFILPYYPKVLIELF